ncbi:MAG: beta-ketoacyl-ACP synthase I [Fluviicoccus sp.]|uniref:beta-ketoacyl-ACP synthase I n=1 Tax=Fluviicoccus sp. TaxID=2003552 RepID=UPI00271ADD68|nr:beta-ketoacyl-ACP synthase I [Fluviicoccus sp.]MDO8331787.1 beta-ketoacyl-ACP synthase I [Fluviicoccus sp.]
MRRVVVTGLGIVSCLGNDARTVSHSLKNGISGLRSNAEYQAMGFRSQVSGRPDVDLEASIDRKLKRFMGDAAAYAYLSMQQAILDAGLTPEDVAGKPRIGVIAGSGGASTANVVIAADTAREKGIKRIGPYMVPRTMTSTVVASLATAFRIHGVNYSISSACATSAHCIGNAMEQIQLNKQDMVFAGGGEEEHWSLSCLFDAMGAMSSKYNDTPQNASRPFAASRDGFVIAGGGGMLVLEEYEHAVKRGARIYAELVGYAATSDGYDMVAPSGEGAARCMQLAHAMAGGSVDYVNAHGTATPTGDTMELKALRTAFGDKLPFISSTKALSGHSLGAAGVQEAIYCLLMMQDSFMAGSANIDVLDQEAEGYPILRESREGAFDTAMSNSFGFGGTNASLVFRKPA